MLSKISRKISFENNKDWIGWEGDIIIEEKGKNETLVGRNIAYKPIVIGKQVDKAEFESVKVTGVGSTYLIGRVISF